MNISWLPFEVIENLLANSFLSVGIDWSLVNPRVVPLAIFLLRTADLTLSTIRLLSVIHGRRASTWFLAVTQSVLYIITVAGVLSNIQNPLNILAYAGGFATGNVVGMWIENRLAPGHNLLRITSSNLGSGIRDALREHGFGVTEVAGKGKAGTVSVLYCFAPRRSIPLLESAVLSVDPDAFLIKQNIRQIRGGWRL